MYKIYKTLTYLSSPILHALLGYRLSNGKELASRVQEKKSIITLPRPHKKLIWFHAASVGEVQSTLIVIKKIETLYPNMAILVTTGTLTSAKLIEPKLPKQAFHQFYPLDHPTWVKRFLDHWRPDMVIWLESELWPNMLSQIKERDIPALLLNAHMSEKSYNTWKKFPSIINNMLMAFRHVLCQTQMDQQRYNELGAQQSYVTDNLKYSAMPLPVNTKSFSDLMEITKDRPIWLYASTHIPEEKIACEIHQRLKNKFPNLLTIIVPRHPERSAEIKEQCSAYELELCVRGEKHRLPAPTDDIYIADTLGELGLFYSLSSIACIGRSLSSDGGGGHNPIEAAQQECAILHGPNVQNLQQIFDEMHEENAAIQCNNIEELYKSLLDILSNPDKSKELQDNATAYAQKKNGVIDTVMKEIIPLLDEINDINNK
ncbi:MAG: 3-deoxy-D-manno-octulosonic acid transferase [Alphaproteobacteria bacterium]